MSKKEIYQIAKSIDFLEAFSNDNQLFALIVHPNLKFKIDASLFKALLLNLHRFYFGKNKVMALALGRTQEDEYKDNLHKLSNQLRGQSGLLFTNKSKKEVLR